MAVSSNSCWVVSCSYDGAISVSNAHSTEVLLELFLPNDMEIDYFDFSPNTNFLAAGCCRGSRIFLWRFQEVLDQLLLSLP